VAQLEAEVQAVQLRRVEDFYDVFNPDKRVDAPGLLRKHGHDMNVLFANLHRHYRTGEVLQRLRHVQDELVEETVVVEELRSDVERLEQQLATKSAACNTLQLEVQNARALRDVLQQAAADMNAEADAAKAEAAREAQQARDEAILKAQEAMVGD
jgi:hypothetical protein